MWSEQSPTVADLVVNSSREYIAHSVLVCMTFMMCDLVPV